MTHLEYGRFDSGRGLRGRRRPLITMPDCNYCGASVTIDRHTDRAEAQIAGAGLSAAYYCSRECLEQADVGAKQVPIVPNMGAVDR